MYSDDLQWGGQENTSTLRDEIASSFHHNSIIIITVNSL